MHTFIPGQTKVTSLLSSTTLWSHSWEHLTHFLRIATVIILFLFVWLLSNNNQLALGSNNIRYLDIFWKLVVPLVPIILLIAPSIWRNVCPLAAINIFGHYVRTMMAKPSTGRYKDDLGMASVKLWLAQHGLYVAMFILYILVPGRLLLLNDNSEALAGLLTLLAIFTFLAGLVLPFKSGWCSSICPVYPVEKAYSISPLVYGDNNLCRVQSPDAQQTLYCGGCTRNCLDLRLTIGNRKKLRWLPTDALRLFISVFPGFVTAYFLLYQFTYWHHLPSILQCFAVYGTFTALMLASATMHRIWYRVLTSHHPPNRQRAKQLDLVFVALSFNIYYLMVAPGFVSTARALLQLKEVSIPAVITLFLTATTVTSLYWLRRAW